MNAPIYDFGTGLEEAARRISYNLRMQSGLTTETMILGEGKRRKLVFLADDADTPTLKRWLCSEMESAAKPYREKACPVAMHAYPDTNRKGAVAVDLYPRLISALVAKL